MAEEDAPPPLAAPGPVVHDALYGRSDFRNANGFLTKPERLPSPKDGIVEQYRQLLLDSLSTAQDFQYSPEDTKLPWESNPKGLLTPTEHAKKLKKLEIMMSQFDINFGVTEADKIEFDKMQNSEKVRNLLQKTGEEIKKTAGSVTLSRMFEIASELAVDQAELDNRRDFRKWLSGRGDSADFAACFWLTDEARTGNPDSREIQRQRSLFEKRKDLWHNSTVKTILDREWQTEQLLAYLSKTCPKSEDEAYLFYNYIVKKRNVNIAEDADYGWIFDNKSPEEYLMPSDFFRDEETATLDEPVFELTPTKKKKKKKQSPQSHPGKKEEKRTIPRRTRRRPVPNPQFSPD